MGQLLRLLATPLRLVLEPVVVSAKTLENFGLLRSALLDAVFDSDAFPEFGALQLRSYEVVAQQLARLAGAGTPTLTWSQLEQSMRPESVDKTIAVTMAAAGDATHTDGSWQFDFQLSVGGVAVSPDGWASKFRFDDIRGTFGRLRQAGLLSSETFRVANAVFGLEDAHQALAAELSALQIPELLERAAAAGVEPAEIEDARDSNDTKGALSGLIVAAGASEVQRPLYCTGDAGDPTPLLVAESLQNMSVKELREHAVQLGVAAGPLEQARNQARNQDDKIAAITALVVEALRQTCAADLLSCWQALFADPEALAAAG